MDAPNTTPHLGPRVKYAREAANLTQHELADAMGFNDRQTVSDIEKGKRAVKADELLKLSEVLDRDVEFFVDPFSVVAEAQYSWRASTDVPQAELDGFELKAGAWVGLLRWMRGQSAVKHDPLKFALRLGRTSTYESAQRAAEQLVERLNLGSIPALKLADAIERQLDIPVLFVDMAQHVSKGSISGAACHLGDLGLILVNRRDNELRRNFDIAHELFHCLTWEAMQPGHRESNSFEDRGRAHRIEQLADNFASALLMPRATLDGSIDKDRLRDVNHLVEVAALLRVTTEALSWRLFNLGLIDRATQQALARDRVVGGDPKTPAPFSKGFVQLLYVGLDRGRLSARKAAKTLGVSLAELTALFAAYEMAAPFEL